MNKLYLILVIVIGLILVAFILFSKENYVLMASKLELEGMQEGVWRLNKQTGELSYCRFNYGKLGDFLMCTRQTNEK